jgi:peroxiredoxin
MGSSRSRSATPALAPAALTLALAALACAGSSGSAPRPAIAGAPAAERLLLTSAAGQPVALSGLTAGREATVLVFWSAGCPCVRRYQDRVDALLEAWPAGRVQVLGVSSNAGEPLAESLAAARQRGVRIPIYRDEGGAVAEALGAGSTPTVVVLDARGQVRFRGWLDNERLPGEPGRQPWLDQALQGLLAGRSDFAARTPVYGCAITRTLFGPKPGPCCTAH